MNNEKATSHPDGPFDIVKQLGSRLPPPSAEPLVPELRSNVKWTPAAAPNFMTGTAKLLIWYFSTPLADADALHLFLRANENTIAQQLGTLTPHVKYLGTYLNTQGGVPRYQTIWAVNPTENWEPALIAALQDATVAPLVQKLRSYWNRDPNARDEEYELAQRYSPLSNNSGYFWDVTLAALANFP